MRNIEKLEKETNHDYAYRVIRENIINLEIKPGTLISEQDIADQLNLSRTPVHEALQELSHTKIVEVMPQRGSFVSLINLELIDEARFMRATIEAAVTKIACSEITEQQLQEMEENVTLQEFYLAKNNLDKIMELDNAFHALMYRITNKLQCLYMVKTLNIHYDRFRELSLHTSNPSVIVEEHKKILQAFQKKDAELAEKLCMEHLSRFRLDVQEVMKKFPEYFEKN